MDAPIDKPGKQKAAMIYGRLLNVVTAGFFLERGLHWQPMFIGWVSFSLATVFFCRAYIYQPSRLDKAMEEAIGLGWAIMMLTLPPLMLAMFAWAGGITAIMWSVLLVGIVVPGFIVWQHFRNRKS